VTASGPSTATPAPTRGSAWSFSLLRNLVYLSGAEMISKVVTFAAVAYVARVAGPTGFGYVEYAAAVLLCAGLLVDQGFGPYGAREIASAPQSTPGVVAEVVTARFVLAVVAFGAILLPAALLAGSPVVAQLLLIYAASLAALPLLLPWVFQGHDQMRTVGVAQVLRQTTFAVVVIAFVRDGSQLWVVAVAEVAGVCSAGALCLWLYERHFGRLIDLRPRLSARLVRQGVPIGLSQMFWMVKMYGATLMVGAIARPEDVGFFAGAQRLLIALHAFVFLYYFNLLPSLVRAWRGDRPFFTALIRRSLHGVAWLAAGVGLVWVASAPAVVVLAYGPAFVGAGPTLQWLAGVWVLTALSGHYRFGLIAAGRQNAEMVTSAAGAAVTLVAVPLGYRLAGLTGVAAGLCFAELTIWSGAWWWARARLDLTGHSALLLRPGAAVTVAGGVLVGLWALPLPVHMLACVTALAGLSLLMDAEVRRAARRVAGCALDFVGLRARVTQAGTG
jgi:PST family polysaccharide transporter